jgi:hypothetical protein
MAGIISSYNMSTVARRTRAEVYIIRVNFFSISEKIKKYESLDSELSILVLAEVMLKLQFIRFGDIVVEADLYNNLKLQNPGFFIYNGSKLQYLDRHVRNIGIIPNNFLSFYNFKLGYWAHILQNNFIWIDSTGLKYLIRKNYIETPHFNIYCNIVYIPELTHLLKSESLILLNLDSDNERNMYFDYKLNLEYISVSKNKINNSDKPILDLQNNTKTIITYS